MAKKVVLLVAAFFCFTATASSDPFNEVVLAKGKASGNHAHATAVVPTSRAWLRARYRTVVARVSAEPRQRVKAGWTMVCSLGTSFGRMSMDKTGRTPFAIPVYADPRPLEPGGETCTIVADATLSGRGRVTVVVVGR